MAQKEHVTILKAKDELSGPIKKATAGINSFTKKIKEANAPFKNLFSSIARFGKELSGIGTVANVIVKSVGKIVSSFKEFEEEWANAEKAIKKIDFASSINKSLGNSTDLKNFAGNLADSIRNVFSQDEIQNAMGTMLFDKTGTQIKQILPVAADLASALGTDLNTAVNQLNQSFSGTVTQLGKIFPELKNFTKEELEAGKAIDLVKEKVSGMAKEMANSTSGSIKNYKDSIENLREELGAMVTSWISPVRDLLAETASFYAKIFSQQRERNEARQAVNNGNANSSQYASVLEELYEREATLQKIIAEHKDYKDLPKPHTSEEKTFIIYDISFS